MLDIMEGIDITSEAHARILARYDRVALYMDAPITQVMEWHANGTDEERRRVQKWIDYDSRLSEIRDRERGILLDDEPEARPAKVPDGYWQEAPLVDKIQHITIVAVSLALLFVAAAFGMGGG